MNSGWLPIPSAGQLTPYLALPPLDIRISKLAEEVTASASNNYDKAIAIERYLRTRFGYTLDLPRTSQRDPLAHFLFERKNGHCEYFASSMAVMLRTIRIPSRIVTGFRGGEFNDLTGQYVVRASNAHSWVEAYFPGNGWVSFDPTPGGSLETHSGWSRMLLYVDAAASFWREWVINYDVTHQQTLGEGAGQSTRRLYDDLRHWFARNYYSLLNSARKTHQQITHSPGRWIGGGLGVTLFLTILVNLRSIVRALANRRLRAHPDRAPRESASLWYDQMLRRLARRGWRKTQRKRHTISSQPSRSRYCRARLLCLLKPTNRPASGNPRMMLEPCLNCLRKLWPGKNNTGSRTVFVQMDQ